jgi:hypothetical protein
MWRTLLGELRSMVIAIPGGTGLFSALQHALYAQPSRTSVPLNPPLVRCLDEWQLLADSLAHRPTSLYEVVPMPPHFVGACDASRAGMGGVWFPTSLAATTKPIVWRAPFPASLQSRLVSADNPTGDINNSMLELAGTIAHDAVLADAVPNHPLVALSGCDNTPAVSWVRRAAVSSDSPVAAMLHFRARLHRAARLNSRIISVPGVDNPLADFASRAFQLDDNSFLSAFSTLYPVQSCWQLRQPPPAVTSKLISDLSRTTPPSALCLPEHDPLLTFGPFGPTSAAPSMPIPSAKPCLTPSLCYRSSPFDIAQATYLPAAVQSASAKWKRRFVPLARRSPDWAFATHALPTLVAN